MSDRSNIFALGGSPSGARLDLGGRPGPAALLGSARRGRNPDRTGRAADFFRRCSFNPVGASDGGGAAAPGGKLFGTRRHQPGRSADAEQYRREPDDGGCRLSPTAGRSPDRRDIRWPAFADRLAGSFDYDTQRGPRRAHDSGGDHGCRWRGTASFSNGDGICPANQYSDATAAARSTNATTASATTGQQLTPRSKLRSRAPGADKILGGLGIALIALDENLVVTYFNLAAQDLFGLSERQALGHSLDEIIASSDELIELCERAMSNGVTIGLRALKVNVTGRELNLDCRASSLESGVLLELHDQSRERKIMRDSQMRAGQRVSKQIVRQLAHEVKNPLGGMRGAAQLLERKLASRELKRYTEIIIAEADRLAALVDRVLSASGTRREQSMNPHELTEHVAQLIAAESPQAVELIRDYDPSLPPVRVDRDQLVQALLNVARNALQAIGDKGRIILRTRAAPNFVIGGRQHRLVDTIEIEDNGPGIPEDLQQNVFFPLVTSKQDGSGIGLTIAQELVSGNGGLLEFDSQPGATVFRIHLPANLPARLNRGDG